MLTRLGKQLLIDKVWRGRIFGSSESMCLQTYLSPIKVDTEQAMSKKYG